MSSIFFAPESHQYVFKIKRDWPNERAETRRYGFQGHLAQKQVFDGLYDRASQVFDLARESFFLAFAGDGTSRSGAEARLDDYDAFLAHVCRGILSPEGLASAQRDLKGRIVLVFHARRHRDPQHEPEPAAPPPAATFSQWDEDTALALAQSSELEHAAAVEKEQCALDAAEQGRADVLQEASALEWAPIPMTQATRVPSPSKYPSLADVPFEHNYQWTWAGPTFPPPPPTTLLSHLPHRATAAAPTVVPAQASTGYSPSYSSAVPVAAEPEPEPEPEPEEPASSPPVVEAWSGVKNLLRTFVHDLNLHLAANFDEAAGFELRLPESDASVPVTKDVPAETEQVKDEVHPSVFCDHCLKTIVGTRFKCTDAACPNWDCCQSCVGTFASFHDGSHVLGAIAKPGATLIKQEAKEAVAPAAVQEALPVLVEHPATCNACDRTIKGVRHKCLNCPDHDLCSSCFTRVSSIHPHHNFLPITDPSSVRMKVQPGERVVHRNIVCDSCEASPIVGVRYLCTHEACGGQFDLCASCEADPVPRHPRSHHLLKIREPVARSSIGPAVELARARTAGPLDGILRSLGISPESNEVAGFASNAQFVDGPGNDRTLVIDLDLDPATTGLPSVIHVPITIPAGGVESVVTEPVVAEPVAAEAVVAEPYETDEVEIETEERDCSLEAGDLPTAIPALAATFVKDVTLIDRSSVAPGALFTKIWQVENTGTEAWPVGTHLVHVGGCLSSSTEDLTTNSVPLAAASEVVEISCDLKAPEDDGRKMYLFRLADANGEHFGDRIWVDVTVESDEDALRQSGDSLSSSIIVPSPASEAPTHVSTDARSIDDESDDSSDEDSEEEDDVESIEISDDSDDSESSDEESDGEFVILSGSEAAVDVDSEGSDGEWEA